MKKLVFVIAIAVYSVSVKAQDQQPTSKDSYSGGNPSVHKMLIWSIGIEPSIPLGHFKRYSGFGLGGTIQAEIKPSDKIGFTINVGYIDYFGKTADTIKYSDFKYWPVMGGLKFYMSSKSYLHGQAGAGFGEHGLGTSFWYGAGIGFNLSKAIDAEFKYTGWKQDLINSGNGTTNNGYGGNGGTGGTSGTGGYGGHYPTIGLRLAYNF